MSKVGVSKTVTIELTMPKELYKRYEAIADYEKMEVIDVIAFVLNTTAQLYRGKLGKNTGTTINPDFFANHTSGEGDKT